MNNYLCIIAHKSNTIKEPALYDTYKKSYTCISNQGSGMIGDTYNSSDVIEYYRTTVFNDLIKEWTKIDKNNFSLNRFVYNSDFSSEFASAPNELVLQFDKNGKFIGMDFQSLVKLLTNLGKDDDIRSLSNIGNAINSRLQSIFNEVIRIKSFSESLNNVKPDKWYVITNDTAPFAGIEKGEFLLTTFKDGKLPGKDKIVLSKDGYISEDAAVDAIRNSKFKLDESESNNFDNIRDCQFYKYR